MFCLLLLSSSVCEGGLFSSGFFFAGAFLKPAEYLFSFQYGKELGDLCRQTTLSVFKAGYVFL